MPVSEEELARILSEGIGQPVTAKEVDDFLHEHYSYEHRFGMHDVLNCARCQKETR